MQKIKIFEQHHKPGLAFDDPGYYTIQLDSDNNPDYGFKYRDNTGDNISSRNFNYVDLTGVYWIWKNVHDAEYKGNVHYRRYFVNNNNHILTSSELSMLLSDSDAIVCAFARLEGRTVYQIFNDFHGHENMDICRNVIQDIEPDYMQDFDDVIVNGEYSSLYNMMIARSDIFDSYCDWLFKILFELEDRLIKLNRLNFDPYDYQRKVFGFIGERLLLVWLKHNSINYIQIPVGLFDDNLNKIP